MAEAENLNLVGLTLESTHSTTELSPTFKPREKDQKSSHQTPQEGSEIGEGEGW